MKSLTPEQIAEIVNLHGTRETSFMHSSRCWDHHIGCAVRALAAEAERLATEREEFQSRMVVATAAVDHGLQHIAQLEADNRRLAAKLERLRSYPRDALDLD